MSHSQFAGQQLSVNDLPVVMEELSDIRAKWYDIGLQLRLRVGTLDAIREQYDDPSHCLRETLKIWLKISPSPTTWKNIVEALRSLIIGEVRLATDLEQKYCSTQDTSVAVTDHHALPALPSQTNTQTTSLQQSPSQGHVPPAPPVPPSQAVTQTTLPPQSTISPTQPPMFASSTYSGTPPSHPPPWSAPYYYSPHTGYLLSAAFTLTPPQSGVATTSVHPSYSQVTQVTSTSSRPLLSSVPAQPTIPLLPTTLPQYPSPPSLTTIPPDTFPILPPATPPDLPLPVTAQTLGMKAEISIFCTMFHLKHILHCYMHSNTTWL